MKINWPPKPTKTEVKNGCNLRSNGEAIVIGLDRWGNDRTARGSEQSVCCDCGLQHLNIYEVVLGPNKSFYLIKRAYRVLEEKKKRRKRRK